MSTDAPSGIEALAPEAGRRVERICLRFEDSWLRNQRPRVVDFLGDAAGAERLALLWELLLLDLDYRRGAGDFPTVDDYQGDFPGDADLIREVYRQYILDHLLPQPPDFPVAGNGEIDTVSYPAFQTEKVGESYWLRLPGFEIQGELGHGGQGVVYLAIQEDPHRPVALKTIGTRGLASAADVQRFRKEVDTIANLDHPHIVKVYGTGEHDGLHYFTMKVMEGGSLDRHLSRFIADQREAAGLIVTVARAMHYAHQRQVLHRDLKPGNILLDAQGLPYVADFGMGKRMEENAGTSSTDGAGTLNYMAPEQAEVKKKSTTAVDIYGLGAILYELLTGRPPFKAETKWETVFQVIGQEPERPRKLKPALSRDLETICLKCLRKDPRKRYGSAEAVAEELERFLRREPILTRPIGRGERFWRWVLRNPALAAVGGLAVAALVGMTVVSTLFGFHYLDTSHRLKEDAQALAAKNQIIRDNNRELRSRTEEMRRALADADRSLNQFRHTLYANNIHLALGAWNDSQLNRVQELLDGKGCCPVGKQTDLRGWEWNYLKSLCRKEIRNFSSPGGHYAYVAFSTNGRWLAAASWNKEVHLWEVATGKRVHIFRHTKEASWVSFSPDNRLLASASWDGNVILWNLVSGKQHRAWKAHPRTYSLAFSPDGRWLATGGEDRLVKIWNVADPTRPRVFSGHTAPVECVAWRSDGRQLASSGQDATARLWDVASGRALRKFQGHRLQVGSVAFSPNGKTLATGSEDRTVRLWNTATGKLVTTFTDHKEWVRRVAFSPDGWTLASVSYDRTVKLWNLATRTLRRTFRGHTDGVNGIAFSPDGHWLASAGFSGPVKLWDTAAGPQEFRRLMTSGLPVIRAVFSPGGRRLATAGRDGTVRLWDVKTGWLLHILQGHEGEVWGLAFSPDGRRLASASNDRTVILWDTISYRRVHTLRGHEDWVWGVAFSPDGRWLASASYDRTVKLWDLTNRKVVRTLKGHKKSVRCVAFRPDGRQLASASEDQTVKVWDRATGRELRTLIGHSKDLWTVAYSRDGRYLASGGRDNEIKLWDARTGKMLRPFRGHTSMVLGVTFHPDGRRLASVSNDRTVKLWDTQSGQEILTLKGHPSLVYSVAFSPDGRRLATAGSGVYLWDSVPKKDSGRKRRQARSLERIIRGGTVAKRRALARRQYRLAGQLEKLSQPQEAERAYRRALSLLERVVTETLGKPAPQKRLAAVWHRLGTLLLREEGRRHRAEQALLRALTIRERLVKESPEVPDLHSDLGATLNDLGIVLRDSGRLKEARRLLEEAVTHQRAALQKNPGHPTYRLFLRIHYFYLAETLVRSGDHAEASRLAGRVVQGAPDPRMGGFWGAGLLARCMTLVEKDPRLSAERRRQLGQSYGDAALKFLRQAIEGGFKITGSLKDHPDLKPLRGRPDFQKLVTAHGQK
jgi:WD40 repeat protein/tetratricopeptide (TPR) repeat protein